MELVAGKEEDKFQFECEVTAGQSDWRSLRKVEYRAMTVEWSPGTEMWIWEADAWKGALGEVRAADTIPGERLNQGNQVKQQQQLN